ncbi:LysR substrate-binding domain-containing protein, partial [Bradyrhizobium sp. UFLA05-112]
LEIKAARAKGIAYLKRGEADLLLGPYDVQEESLYHRNLLDDHYVCVMHRGHPLAGRRLRVDDYVTAVILLSTRLALADGAVEAIVQAVRQRPLSCFDNAAASLKTAGVSSEPKKRIPRKSFRTSVRSISR